MALQSKAHDELRLLAETYFELGKVRDIVEGMNRASAERPDLAQQYYADKRAASATLSKSAGDQLIAKANLYQQAHACTPTEAQTAVLRAHPDLAQQQRWEHQHPERPMPVAKAERLSYDDIRQTVALRAQRDGSTTDDAWCALLNEDVPWHADVRKAYRTWQLYEVPATRSAPVEAFPPLTPAELRKMVKAMPDPPTTPSMDFLHMRAR